MKSSNLLQKLILFLSFQSLIVGQNFVLDYKIGNFTSASAFSINSAGFIFVTDDGDDSLIKLDTIGNLIKEIGGYGWGESAFDTPSDVFTTALNVLVCDKRNHRVQSFDKDLNFISELYTRESNNLQERFGFPLSCALSSMGDLFILDSENSRILKFDLFGSFIQNFGGFDAGIFSLTKPKKIALSANDFVFVLDDSSLIAFDQFGNGKAKLKIQNSFTGIKVTTNMIILNDECDIYFKSVSLDETPFSKINLVGFNKDEQIISADVFNNKLYVLTQKEISVFIKTSD